MKTLKSKILKSTEREYEKSLQRLYKVYNNCEIIPDDFSYNMVYSTLKNPEKIESLFDELSIQDITKRNYINSIIICLRNNLGDDKIIKKYMIIRDKYLLKHNSKNISNDSNQEDYISLENIQQLIKKLKLEINKNKCKMQKYILLKMFILFRKKNQLVNIKIYYNTDPENIENYIVIYPKHIYFHTRGFNKNKLDKNLKFEIKELLKLDPERQYLFVSKNNRPYEADDIGRVLRQILHDNFNHSIRLTNIQK